MSEFPAARILAAVLLLALCGGASAQDVDPKSGLLRAEGYSLVAQHCTVCHSSALITQNRASREGWRAMIRWMQEKQGLWPLGESEAAILDYLAANYPPRASGRRPALPPALMPPG